MLKRAALLRVGGVPEHFNWPFLRAGAKSKNEFEWREYPQGSGAMAADLKNDVLDVAVMLTEALVAEAAKGAPFKLWGAYTATPLVWGVHARADSAFATAGAAPSAFAVSRFGSGSHIMALVDAKTRGAAAPSFKVVNTLDGARKALAAGEADAFMWEKFTTKHLVDSGEWARIAEVPTPWPCFSVAVKDGVDLELVSRILGNVRAEAEALVADPEAAVSEIASQYDQQPADVREWLSTVRWCARPQMPRSTLQLVHSTLVDAGVVPSSSASSADVVVVPGVTQVDIASLTSVGIPSSSSSPQ